MFISVCFVKKICIKISTKTFNTIILPTYLSAQQISKKNVYHIFGSKCIDIYIYIFHTYL